MYERNIFHSYGSDLFDNIIVFKNSGLNTTFLMLVKVNFANDLHKLIPGHVCLMEPR